MKAMNAASARPAAATCPQCGAALVRHQTDGFCSRCLAETSLLDDEFDGPAEDALNRLLPATLTDRPTRPRLGDFEILEELARGGMGVVFKARQTSLNRTVALKMMLFGGWGGAEATQRFRTEAAAAALEHPHIVRVLHLGEHDGQPFIAMQYVAGRSLADALRDRPLPAGDAAQCVATIARAIEFAHGRGILHRDLKPSNILLDPDGTPHVTDFGLAKFVSSETTLTGSCQTLGSPNYAPPEQATHGADVDARSDVYGLGAILYHALTGRPPFHGQSPADVLVQVRERPPVPPCQLDPGLPRDLETICLKCLEKEPAKRYPTAQALADDLDRFLNHEPIHARPVTRLERTIRWCRRKPALATAYGLLLLLLLLLLIASPIAAYRINEARHQAAREADTARAMLAFLRDDLLSVADPFAGNTERPRGRNLTLLAAVDLAARNVRQRFPDQPLVEAGLRVTLWQVYFALGDLDQAEEHIHRAAELYDGTPDAPELQRLKAIESMAWMHHARGRYAEASALIEPVLERRTRLQGADHPEVLSAQRCRLAILSSSGRHPEAMALGEDLLDRARQLPVEHTEVLLRIWAMLLGTITGRGSSPGATTFRKKRFRSPKSGWAPNTRGRSN